MQLLLAFIILSFITLIVILLILLSRNSRSQKIRTICQAHNWQYQEFVNFNDTIKHAHFGLLNYSQNAIFRHVISADDSHLGLGFNVFDCLAIEPTGIHNSTALLFNLKLDEPYNELHASFSPLAQGQKQQQDSGLTKPYFQHIRRLQKLVQLKPHYAFECHDLYANKPALLEQFLQQHLRPSTDNADNCQLSTWLLAHPNLHIEISNGMLLAYQPNHLLHNEAIFSAITHVAEISLALSRKN